MNNISRLSLYILCALLILVWSINWLVMKVALSHISAYWFTAMRLGIATICMFLLLILTRRLQWPKRQDLPLIASIGIIQLGFYMLLINIALNYVDVGRSAILSYATIIWVTPITILFFKEIWTTEKSLSVLLSFIGILILVNPWSLDWSNHDMVFGNGLLVLASLLWASTIIHTRFGTWHSHPLDLVPWQLLSGCAVASSIALWQDPNPNITWQWSLSIELLYSGILSTAFGVWALLYLTKRLSALTTSLVTLLVPPVGMIFSCLFLHEVISISKVSAIILIFAGVCINVIGKIEIRKYLVS